MSFDYVEVYHRIVDEYAAGREPNESMRRVIDECASRRPHPDWEWLRQLPYGDLSALEEWIEKPLQLDPPSERQAGLWFGMFNPYVGDEPVADIYISGSKEFDPDPFTFEWACGPDWRPDDRYANSEVMAMIYRIAYAADDGLKNDAEYPLCLAYGALAIRALLNGLDPALIPATIVGAGVAVGFDSGDGILLGRLTSNGLEPS
ncbi:MAG TPA: hypothetical protein VIK18_17125 [Pirellulales bacterium]